MSGEKKSWPKLRFPFRKTAPHETPRKRSDTQVSNTTLIVPVYEVEPRTKSPEHAPHTESVRSSSTWTYNSSASHGDSYDSSWSAQTGCTTPGANLGSFSGHAVSPAAYPRTCSPRISGDLEGRLGSAYNQIQNMPPSPISPTIRQMTGDPRTQFGVPQHSVINQPTLRMPSLPNPHTTHPRSQSQPLPSSLPVESLPASCTWESVPEPNSAPRFRHPQVQAQSQKYHQPPSLQFDLNIHPNDHHPTTLLHSSQTSPPMILGPIKPYHAGAVAPSLPQPDVRSELPLQRRSKLIKRQLAAPSHVSSPSHITSEETGTEDGHISMSPLQKRSKLVKRRSALVSHVSSSPPSPSHIPSEETSTPNQESNSNKHVRNQGLLPLIRPPSPLRLDIVSPSTKCTWFVIDLLPSSRCISHGMIGDQTLGYHACRKATAVIHQLPCQHQALKRPVPALKHLRLWLGLVHLPCALLSRHLLALRNTPNPALFRLTRRFTYP